VGVEGATFRIDWMALLSVIYCSLFLFWALRRRFAQESVYSVNMIALEERSLRAKLAGLPLFLKKLALFCMMVALIDPHEEVPFASAPPPETQQESPVADQPPSVRKLPTRGIAAYLLLDQSGSMATPVVLANQKGQQIKITRMDLLKEVTREFIVGNPSLNLPGHPSDMLGLVAFARIPEVLSPLTLDHELILQELKQIQPITNDKLNGTGIGYAIYKTVDLIAATKAFAEKDAKGTKSPYKIERTIIVLFTDGFEELNPADAGNPLRSIDVKKAAAFAKEHEIRLYIVNVDPNYGGLQYRSLRKEMEKDVESTGGKFFLLQPGQGIIEIYREIDKLAKEDLPGEVLVTGPVARQPQASSPPTVVRGKEYAPYFIKAALFFLLLSILLETSWLRRAP
jgi:Ca-activated chloride channel family protein